MGAHDILTGFVWLQAETTQAFLRLRLPAGLGPRGRQGGFCEIRTRKELTPHDLKENEDGNDRKTNDSNQEVQGNAHGRWGRPRAARARNLTPSLAAEAANDYETTASQTESAAPNTERQRR